MSVAFDQLCSSIGYPKDEVRRDGEFSILVVDGEELRVTESAGRLVFRYVLLTSDGDGHDDRLPRLAEYAAGRLLKEEAVLAWDETQRELFLWQSAPANADSKSLTRIFELFLTSCDWWRSRVEEETAEEHSPMFPEVCIRP